MKIKKKRFTLDNFYMKLKIKKQIQHTLEKIAEIVQLGSSEV